MSLYDIDSDDESYYGPPFVDRGAFTFKEGRLYARFEGPCHPRADSAELYRLLTYAPPPPLMTKAGTVAKRQPKDTHVDPEAHYYSAQMIHYGLKPFKTKIPAKKKLLAAYGDKKTLQVPKGILDLEASMKQEWEILMVKYKEQQEQQRKIQLKRDEEARLEMLEWEEKKRLEEPTPAPETFNGSKKVGRTDGDELELVDNSIQARVLEATTKMPRPVSKNSKMTSIERRKEIASLSADQARTLLLAIWERIPAVENVLDSELSAIIDARSSPLKENTVDPSTWTGLYDVEAPMILDDQNYYDSRPLTLEIYSSSTSAHLWASFELGVLKGVMRSLYPVPKFLNTEIFFEYRGYEAGEDTMTFSEDNRAILTFLPSGLFEGKINTECFGTFKLHGALKVQTPNGKPVGHGKSVAQQRQAVESWKADFRSINYHNYEVAGRSRWGGWGGDTQEDKAFESDTTDGNKKHKKIDLHRFMRRAKDDLNGEDGSDSDSNSEDQDHVGLGYECDAL